MDGFVPPFKIKITAVYVTITDSGGKLFLFMGMDEHDIKNARKLIGLINKNIR